MKLLAPIAIFFALATTQASTDRFLLNVDLSMKGKHVTTATYLVDEGELHTFTQKSDHQNTFIAVITKRSNIEGQKGILMEFTIGTIDGSGKRIVASNPQIFAQENQEASISIGDSETQTEDLVLKVTARTSP